MSSAPSGAADTHGLPPLRRLPVPLAQPRPALRVVRDEPDAVSLAQGTLALPLAGQAREHADDPAGRDPVNPAGDPNRTAGAGPHPEPTVGNPRRAPSAVLPEPRQWAAQFVQAAVEVTTGLRPPSQLVRWTNDEVRTLLARRADLARNTGARARQPRRGIVRSARVCIPRDGVAEATVVISDGPRIRAVALRLEGTDGRWRVTALRIC
jgi:hypothetical protein